MAFSPQQQADSKIDELLQDLGQADSVPLDLSDFDLYTSEPHPEQVQNNNSESAVLPSPSCLLDEFRSLHSPQPGTPPAKRVRLDDHTVRAAPASVDAVGKHATDCPTIADSHFDVPAIDCPTTAGSRSDVPATDCPTAAGSRSDATATTVAGDAATMTTSATQPPPPTASASARPHPTASPVLSDMHVRERGTMASSEEPALNASSAGTPAASSVARRRLRLAAKHRSLRRSRMRRQLEGSNISATLLAALDAFVASVPPVPTHVDPSRKTPIRDMRGWIGILDLSGNDGAWGELMNAIRTQSSVKPVHSDWDHKLCHFLLNEVLSKSDTGISRQAFNNAIKRELMCPTAQGRSSRGKTFRDLFRQKCLNAGVKLPPLQEKIQMKSRTQVVNATGGLASLFAAIATPSSPLSASGTTSLGGDSDAKVPQHDAASRPTMTDLTDFIRELEEQSTPNTAAGNSSVPHQLHQNVSLQKLTGNALRLQTLRESCLHQSEWGHTAWWNLACHADVERLPHLLAEENLFELRDLLVDFRWIARTFRCVDFSTGMQNVPTIGYNVMLEHCHKQDVQCSPAEVEGFRLIRNAITLILPIMSKDLSFAEQDDAFKAHLATQLAGRLLDSKRRFSNIASLMQSIESYAPRPWLRPLTKCFQQPRTDVKLAVPSNGTLIPHLIALSDDGALLATSGCEVVDMKAENATGGRDRPLTDTPKRKIHSLSIWDVQSGKRLFKSSTPDLLRRLALARDNSCVILETADGLFFWHLDKSEETWKIACQVEATPRSTRFLSITPMADPKQVLTTHRGMEKSKMVLWDTQTGRRLHCFDTVNSDAICVDVSVSGSFFASGHDDGFIHLWSVNQKDPVLSFENAGTSAGRQQLDTLKDVNHAFRPDAIPVTSLSLIEIGEEMWVAAVSAVEMIRIWQLPPRHTPNVPQDEWKLFVSTRRTAVLRCPLVRDVQWLQAGTFVTSGDDGVVRLWQKSKTDNWQGHAINKEDRKTSSRFSAVLMSSGKQSRFVATYMTRSPYVAVMDVSKEGDEEEKELRESLYRAHFPVIATSVDATDMSRFRELYQLAARSPYAGASTGPFLSGSYGSLPPPSPCNKYLEEGGGLGLRFVRAPLERFFSKLDTKNAAQPEGVCQPWLRVMPTTIPDSHLRKPLRVCFEGPVITAVCGEFMESKHTDGDDAVGAVVAKSNDADEAERGAVGSGRHGLAAVLRDGSVAIFELESKPMRKCKN